MRKLATIRPALFVGSSTENLDVAYAVQENLERVAEVTVWTQGIFKLSDTSVESLLAALPHFDFAVLVFAPDDITRLRDKDVTTPRDNVVFELGLFISRLGKQRTFILLPRGGDNLHVPTDLVGLTPATYDAHRQDRNLQAALGPACNKLAKVISDLGPVTARTQARSVPSVAAGLADELRVELARTFTKHGTKMETVFSSFEAHLAMAMKSLTSVQRADPLRLASDVTKKKLSPEAQALLVAVSDTHLTARQYRSLLDDNKFGVALGELRAVGFLIPLAGRDEKGDKIPVYWFPPELSGLLRTLSKRLLGSKARKIDEARCALRNVGYGGRRMLPNKKVQRTSLPRRR